MINFHNLSLQELRQLQTAVEKELTDRRVRQVIAAFEELVKSSPSNALIEPLRRIVDGDLKVPKQVRGIRETFGVSLETAEYLLNCDN